MDCEETLFFIYNLKYLEMTMMSSRKECVGVCVCVSSSASDSNFIYFGC